MVRDDRNHLSAVLKITIIGWSKQYGRVNDMDGYHDVMHAMDGHYNQWVDVVQMNEW